MRLMLPSALRRGSLEPLTRHGLPRSAFKRGSCSIRKFAMAVVPILRSTESQMVVALASAPLVRELINWKLEQDAFFWNEMLSSLG
jgi:hypothetical protein